MKTTDGGARATFRLPPHRRTVPTRTRVRVRRFSLVAYVLVLLLLPAGAVAAAKATGWWVTTGRAALPNGAVLGAGGDEPGEPGVAGTAGAGTVPGATGAGSGAAGQGTGEAEGTGAGPSEHPSAGAGNGTPGSGPSAGTVDRTNLPATPDDVKGWHTVAQVLAAFPQVGAAEIFDRFGVPASTPTSRQLKELAESGNGLDIPHFRSWLKTRV